MPLNVLVPKLTLKSAKEVANLHDMYMPSKILLKNAQILLEKHKCETCPDLHAVFKPYKVASNAERQQTWYQNNKEKRAEYNMQPQYQASNRESAWKYYWSKKMSSFHQIHLQQICVRILYQISVLTLLQKCLKKLVVQFVQN